MNYGNKRDYPKIDLYLKRKEGPLYLCSTTWAKTCKEAVARYVEIRGGLSQETLSRVYARFAKDA